MATHSRLSRILALIAATLLSTQFAAAAPKRAELPAAERQKIEALIAAVETLQEVVFVRNGRAYPPATAAKFLRGKWKQQAAKIASAEDFIVNVATASSTSGKPYLVRFKDGREVPAAAFFRARLAALR